MEGQEKHRCRFCGRTFRSEAGLKSHLRQEHFTRYYLARVILPLSLILVGAAVLGLIALPQSGDRQAAGTTSLTPPPTQATATAVKAPGFSLPVYNYPGSKTVSLSDFEGKPVFLEFFAPKCRYCLEMIPVIEKIYEQYGDRVVFIIISVPDKEGLDEVAKKYELRPMVLMDDSRLSVFRSYQVTGTPTFVVLDKNHNIAQVIVGETSESTLVSAIKKVLG